MVLAVCTGGVHVVLAVCTGDVHVLLVATAELCVGF